MSSLDQLLDTTWSLHYVSTAQQQRSTSSILQRIVRTRTTGDADQDLSRLSRNCHEYLTSQTSTVTDDLNNESEKRGALQDCTIRQLWYPDLPSDNTTTARQSLGLLIEIRFQKTLYRAVLLYSPSTISPQDSQYPISLILFKAPANYIKQINEWLGVELGISLVSQLRLPSELVLRFSSQYLSDLSQGWAFSNDDSDAVEQATLKQVIGNLKLTVTVSETAKADIDGKLRTIDLDVPSGTVYTILQKISQRRRSDAQANSREGSDDVPFLGELAEAIRLRTGLKLPLAQTQQQTALTEESMAEPPLRVTRISCTAFAISTDGRLKLTSRPVEDAEMIGYDRDLVRKVNLNALESIREEAERRSKDEVTSG